MWSYCYSLVSAAESLQCIRISALLLSLEGWDEFRRGSERWLSAVPGELFVVISHLWLQSWLISCSAAIEFQLGNGPQHHQGLLTLAQPKLSGPKTQVNCAWAAVAALGTSMHPQVHVNILLLTDLWTMQNELPLFTGSLEGFGNELH